jgi:hypothetical protein
MSYKILSLDGGGTWAIIQVMILQDRYGNDAFGHEILEKYNMAIANSGGSIVLAGLCLNMKLSEIRDLFENEKILKSIFDKNLVGTQFSGKYSAEKKKKALEKNLKSTHSKGITYSTPLHEIPQKAGLNIEIVVTGFDYTRSRAVYFRSNRKSKMESFNIIREVTNDSTHPESFEEISLIDAIHVSTNAPVKYFDRPAEYNTKIGPRKFKKLGWDGGVGGNNNPVFSGILEAISNGIDKNKIYAVSIGTANTLLPVIYNNPGEPSTEEEFLISRVGLEGNVSDIAKMASAIIGDPPDAATFNAFHLLGLEYKQNDNRLIRINPLIKPILDENGNVWKKPGNNWSMKDMRAFFKMDMATNKEEDVQLIIKFTEDFKAGFVDNQGIRVGGKRLEPILGHKIYKDALDDWKSHDQLM